MTGAMVVVSIAAFAWIAILRHQVQERTRQTKKALALFEASLSQSPSGIIIADAPEMAVRWANPAALGFCALPFPGAQAAKLAHPLDYWHGFRTDGKAYQANELPLARAILKSEVTCNEELILRNAKGEDRWVSVNAAPIRDDKGAISAGIMVFHDITANKLGEKERDKLQTQLVQAQKMESVGRLAGGVAHDFNNMLQVIIGNVALAMEQMPPRGEFRENLCEIQKAAQKSADLTSQLLAFARKQIARPSVLDLNQAISRTLKLLQRLIGENIDLAWIPGPDIWPVFIDSIQLDQILTNLTVNARDAIPGTGKITIETSNTTLDEDYARTNPEARPGDYAMLAVSDSGIGMSKETQSHLFEPFFTTKGVKEGTGLGLATIYGIVKQNNGLINVYSEPGEGTTFKIYLPRVAAEVKTTVDETPSQSLRGTETILLVEDEEQVLRLGQRALTQNGYTVLAVGAPKEALALAAQGLFKIDLMITDVIMPGMNGKELNRQILAMQPGMKCLFMSGYTANVIAHHGVLDDGILFLQKPFSIQTLTKKVREVLAS
jgi:signal transduction histidine kinase